MTDSGRLLRESDFHDAWARSTAPGEVLVRESFEAPTAIENRHILSEMGDLRGRRVLDLGCGAGEGAVYFATRGAESYACDIAEEFLKLAGEVAGRFGVTVRTRKADTAALPYADGFFDWVYGNGILHHVDLDGTAREVYRVLKPGGQAAFIEPLPYNPAINVYRHLARGVRSADEKPLRFRDLERVGRVFGAMRHREFWFLSLAVFFHFFLVRRWHPSKVRYWKKVIEEGPRYAGMIARLGTIDRFLLDRIPGLGRLAWNTVILVRKPTA